MKDGERFNLKVERLRRELRQTDLERLCGVRNYVISGFETGRINLKDDELARLRSAIFSKPPLHDAA